MAGRSGRSRTHAVRCAMAASRRRDVARGAAGRGSRTRRRRLPSLSARRRDALARQATERQARAGGANTGGGAEPRQWPAPTAAPPSLPAAASEPPKKFQATHARGRQNQPGTIVADQEARPGRRLVVARAARNAPGCDAGWAPRRALAFGIGAAQGIEDVRHGGVPRVGLQGAAASRGSSTPVARLSCMKVVGPALPIRAQAVRRLEADDLGAQRRIHGLVRRRHRLAGRARPAGSRAGRRERHGGALGEQRRCSRAASARALPNSPRQSSSSARGRTETPAPGRPASRVARVVVQADRGPRSSVRPRVVAQAEEARVDRGSSAASPGCGELAAAHFARGRRRRMGRRCRDRPSRAPRARARPSSRRRRARSTVPSVSAAPRSGPAARRGSARASGRAPGGPPRRATDGATVWSQRRSTRRGSPVPARLPGSTRSLPSLSLSRGSRPGGDAGARGRHRATRPKRRCSLPPDVPAMPPRRHAAPEAAVAGGLARARLAPGAIDGEGEQRRQRQTGGDEQAEPALRAEARAVGAVRLPTCRTPPRAAFSTISVSMPVLPPWA